MPSRSEMDTPAIVTVLVLGVVLIAVSAPFLGSIDDEASPTYLITWTEAEAGSAQAATGTAGSTSIVRVPVTDSLPSTATIALEACADGASPLSQPATISWVLFEGPEMKDDGTLQCGDGPVAVDLEPQPDVGQASAASPTAAQRKAYAAGDNETLEFRVEFSWNRPGGAVPLPLPAPFAATLSLTIEEWRATANEPGQEVPR